MCRLMWDFENLCKHVMMQMKHLTIKAHWSWVPSPSLPFFSLEWLLSFILSHAEANIIIYLFAYQELGRTGWLEVVPSTWFGGQPFVSGDECILANEQIGLNLSWVGYLVQFQSCVGVFRTMGLLPSFVLAFWRREELLLPSFPSSYPKIPKLIIF